MPNIARFVQLVKKGRSDEYRAERCRKEGKERVLLLLQGRLSFRGYNSL